MLRDNLDIGRPDQIGLVFARRIVTRGRHPTPGKFRTRVITDGVTPSLHVDYKNSKIKQYHKLGKAIRTETTINDTRDFGLSKRLTNLPALRQIGSRQQRRPGHQPQPRPRRPGIHLTTPVVTPAGTRIPCCRPCSSTGCCPAGSPSELRTLIAPLLGKAPEDTRREDDLRPRRLREHGLIARIPKTRRYQVTDTGLHEALLFTHAHDHLLHGLAQLTDPSPPAPSGRPPTTTSAQA